MSLKPQLVTNVREHCTANKFPCARLAFFVAEPEVMGRRIVRRGAVIASRGSMCNTQSVHCHGQLSADQYAQQPQAARQRCVTIHRAHTRYSTCVGEPSPKPQLVAMKKGSTGSIRPDSLRLKPSQMDQDLHEQVGHCCMHPAATKTALLSAIMPSSYAVAAKKLILLVADK